MGGRGTKAVINRKLSPEEIRKANAEYHARIMAEGRAKLQESLRQDLENIKPYKEKNYSLSNREGLINYIKQQINVDISPYIEERTRNPKTYLGVHLEKMPQNDRNSIKNLLQNSYNNNIRIEYNGGLGYAIYYKKERK